MEQSSSRHHSLTRRILAVLSVLLFSLSILVYLWWGRFQYNHHHYLAITYSLCIAIVLFSHFYHRDNTRRLGIRWDNARSSLFWYGGFTLFTGILIIFAGALFGQVSDLDWDDGLQYFLWAGIQQYLLQNFIRLRLSDAICGLNRTRQISGKPILIVLVSGIAASLFALIHAPESNLMLLTLLGGFCWCLLYFHVPNFFAAWISQAIVGLLLILFFKQGVLGQFQIGQPGYRYVGYGEGVQVAAGCSDLGVPVIATLPGPLPSNRATIRLFSWQGKAIREWNAFEKFGYSGRFSIGDLGYGPGDEIAVCPGPGPGNPPLVRIFDFYGVLLDEFTIPHFDEAYGSWLTIRNQHLYVTPGPGPDVDQSVFEVTPQGQVVRRWNLDIPDFHNGLKAVLCRLQKGSKHAGKRETIVAWGTAVAQNPSRLVLWDPENQTDIKIETIPTTFGASAALVELKNDRTGIAVGPGPFPGYPAWIKVFALEPEPRMLFDIAPYESAGSCGVNLSAVDVTGDGIDELVIGEGTGPQRPALVRICQLNGKILSEWRAF